MKKTTQSPGIRWVVVHNGQINSLHRSKKAAIKEARRVNGGVFSTPQYNEKRPDLGQPVGARVRIDSSGCVVPR